MSYYLDMANQALADYEAKRGATNADALAIVTNAGCRLLTHQGERVVVVSPNLDTGELRAALATLGYGGCRVLHLDMAPYRGQPVSGV